MVMDPSWWLFLGRELYVWLLLAWSVAVPGERAGGPGGRGGQVILVGEGLEYLQGFTEGGRGRAVRLAIRCLLAVAGGDGRPRSGCSDGAQCGGAVCRQGPPGAHLSPLRGQLHPVSSRPGCPSSPLGTTAPPPPPPPPPPVCWYCPELPRYSARLRCDGAGCISVASGTVFGRILLWHCHTGETPTPRAKVNLTLRGHEVGGESVGVAWTWRVRGGN